MFCTINTSKSKIVGSSSGRLEWLLGGLTVG